MDAPTDQEAVASVSCKSRVPPFIESDPALWFLQLSSHFISERITSQKAKFHAAVSALPRSSLYQIAPLLKAQGEAPFDELQERLQRIYGISTEQRIQALINNPPSGDQRPSHLLNIIRYQLTDAAPDDVVKALWTKQLTPETRRALISSNADSLDDLAVIADRLSEVRTDSVDAVQPAAPPDDLQQQLKRLTTAIDRLSRPRDRSRSKDNDRRRSPSARRTRSNSPAPGLCFFHRKWGPEARKCTPPCSFSAGNADRRPSA